MGVKLRERPGKGWYVLTDWHGQRKAKFFGKNRAFAKAFADKLAAKLKWAEQSGEAVALSTPDGTMPTLEAYLREWLTTYAEVHCKPTTAKDYRQVLERHIFPALGSRPMYQVSRADIRRLIAAFVAQGRKKQTIHNILAPLKEAYHHAMDEGLLTMNPVARTGRLTRTREDRKAHITPLTAGEVRLLLRTAQDHLPVLFPLLLCAVRTGLRESELIGLQWGDVDFEGRFIEVRRGIVRRHVTTTKSHKIRRVDLSPQLMAVLQQLADTHALEAGLTGQERPDWVFLTPDGKRVSDTTLRRAFYHCLGRAGLRRVRFHDLRHTYASLLIQQGAKPKYIQAQLGHGSIQVTMDIYGHLFEGDDRHVVSRLDDPQADAVQDPADKAESATQPQPRLDAVETALT